jgi:CRP-like cAMP-binding protein
VDDFTRYLWTAHKGSVSEDEFILHLPHSLLTLTLQQRARHIRNCPFFDFCSSNIIDALAVCMRPLIFCAGDIIAHPGDMGQEMFFLDKGVVEVVSPDKEATVFATLVEGSYFGETSLIFKKPRAVVVKAATFCDILELLKRDLFAELKTRDVDLMQMLNTFSRVYEDNKRRNKAIQDNLVASKNKEHKLSRIIDTDASTRTEKRNVPHCFLPGTTFRFVWDMMCTAGITYFTFFTLFRIAFRPVEADTAPLVLLDFAIDAFFALDFFLRSTYFAFPSHGSVSTDINSIKQHYRKHGMVLDFISCFSLIDVLSYKWVAVRRLKLRLLCLLRVIRIPDYFDLIAEHLSLRDVGETVS